MSLELRLQLCADGWYADAQLYRGRRREWRLQRADRLYIQSYTEAGI